MNAAKRAKYAALATTTATVVENIKEEVLPVIIHNPHAEPGQEYTYATFATAEDADAAVVQIQNHHALANGQEIIIDEHGHAVTIQQLVENNTVEEVEAIESNDGQTTIVHIMQHEEVEDHGEHEESVIECDGEGNSSADDSMNAARSKTFYCSNCGNCYSAAGSLKLHMRACLRQRQEVPPEERTCKMCNKVFNSVSYLKEHMMRHTGEGPRRCTRCYRKFIDDDKWKAHMETHKQQDKLDAEAEALAAKCGGKKIVLKEFTCSFCSQNFTVAFDVGKVKRRYACDTCREKYSNTEALKKHKQLVDDKREFHCERCGRKFVFEGFLQRHLPTCDGTIKRRRDMK